MGLDPQETFTERDETRNVQNSVGIQIVKLNPISEKETSKGEAKVPEGEMQERLPGSPRVDGE
jgi:hypothetical protein